MMLKKRSHDGECDGYKLLRDQVQHLLVDLFPMVFQTQNRARELETSSARVHMDDSESGTAVTIIRSDQCPTSTATDVLGVWENVESLA
jgi:hypothetical protein